MICELSAYAWMPNTMGVGAMAGVIGQHPDLLYAPIEVKGDAEIHALSRCQMILTEARQRARQEFDEALIATGMSLADLRRREKRHPAVRRAIYPVPHMGHAGTATNYMLAL